MGPAGRFQPRPCRACQGISKTRCMFCGQFFNMKKKDMTSWELLQYDAWCEKMEYLRTTYKKLITCKMRSTGCEELDNEILLHIGDWRNKYK